MRRVIASVLLLGGVAAVLAGALTASSAETATDALLTIRHANVGCHVWTAHGSTYAAKELIALAPGQTFRVENRDTCSHKLVQTSGPAVAQTENLAGGSGTSVESFTPGVQVTMPQSGTYTFSTVEDDTFMYGWQNDMSDRQARITSSGADNTLELTVIVPASRSGSGDGHWELQPDDIGVPWWVWVPAAS